MFVRCGFFSNNNLACNVANNDGTDLSAKLPVVCEVGRLSPDTVSDPRNQFNVLYFCSVPQYTRKFIMKQ